MEQEMNHEEVREKVKGELHLNSVLRDQNILVDFEGDEIILEGDVDSSDKKWLAQDIANDVPGVLHVSNRIQVVEADPGDPGSYHLSPEALSEARDTDRS